MFFSQSAVMPTKDPVLSVRLPKEVDDRLSAAADKLDLSKNDIARHAIRAALAAIEANGFKITLPLEMAVKDGPVQSRPSAKTEAPVRTGSTASPGVGGDLGAGKDSPRFSMKEEPSAVTTAGPRPRSARPGIQKIVGDQKPK